MPCVLDPAKGGAFTGFDGVDAIGGSLSQTGKHVLNGVRTVAVSAQVGEENLTPARAVDRLEEVASRSIGKVAMPTADALLDGPGTFFVPFEQLRAIVGFDDERINISNALGDAERSESEVGEPGKAANWGEEVVASSGFELEPYGVVGVVRHGEAFDGEAVELEGGARVEDFPVRLVLELRLDRSGGHHVGEDDRGELFGEGGNAGGVVGVLVGDEYRVDLLRSHPAFLEHAAEPLAAESCVDEDLAVFRDQEPAVAGAATAEDGKLHGHRKRE